MADRARALVSELEASGAARELVGPAVGRAKQALSQAEAASPDRAPAFEDTALEWAEVARDLVRASEAEHASDALEQEASSLATEIARLRAAVEQAMARVGRARQDARQLEAPSARAAPAHVPASHPGAPSPTASTPATVDGSARAKPSPAPAPAPAGASTAAPPRAPAEPAPAAREQK